MLIQGHQIYLARFFQIEQNRKFVNNIVHFLNALWPRLSAVSRLINDQLNSTGKNKKVKIFDLKKNFEIKITHRFYVIFCITLACLTLHISERHGVRDQENS